jgi:hypothetical protein
VTVVEKKWSPAFHWLEEDDPFAIWPSGYVHQSLVMPMLAEASVIVTPVSFLGWPVMLSSSPQGMPTEGCPGAPGTGSAALASWGAATPTAVAAQVKSSIFFPRAPIRTALRFDVNIA